MNAEKVDFNRSDRGDPSLAIHAWSGKGSLLFKVFSGKRRVARFPGNDTMCGQGNPLLSECA